MQIAFHDAQICGLSSGSEDFRAIRFVSIEVINISVMKFFLLPIALWVVTFVAALPQDSNAKHLPQPDCTTTRKPSSTKATLTSTLTSTKKTSTSTKKTSTSTKKTATTTKKTSTTTKKTSTSTKKTSTSTKKTSAPTTTTTKKSTSTSKPLSSSTKPTVSSSPAPSSSLPVTSTPVTSVISVPVSVSVSVPVSVSVSVPVSSTVPAVCVPNPTNAVANGGFGAGAASWTLANTAVDNTLVTQFANFDGTDTDPTNTASFIVQSKLGDSSFNIGDVILSQTVPLCAGIPYTYTYHLGIDPMGEIGGTRCNFAFRIDGVQQGDNNSPCNGPYVPDDYGSCVEPTAANPAVRYQIVTGMFTPTSDSALLELDFTCYYDTQSDNPAAVLDNIIIAPV